MGNRCLERLLRRTDNHDTNMRLPAGLRTIDTWCPNNKAVALPVTCNHDQWRRRRTPSCIRHRSHYQDSFALASRCMSAKKSRPAFFGPSSTECLAAQHQSHTQWNWQPTDNRVARQFVGVKQYQSMISLQTLCSSLSIWRRLRSQVNPFTCDLDSAVI